MRVLVTGGRGFLGSHLCTALADRGAEVYAVSRERMPPPSTAGDAQWLRADLSDIDAAQAVWKAAQPDVVFHLTTHGVGSPELENVQATLLDDLLPTVNMLTAAARVGSGARIVLAASLEEPAGPKPAPGSPYAAAKWAGTGYARMFHALYGTPVVITRPFMTYGPGQQPHKLVPHVIRSLLEGRAPKVTSGRRLVDWVFVDDVVRGLILAGERPGIEGAEIDLGSGELVTVREVVERLVELTGTGVPVEFGSVLDRRREIERRADTATAFDRLGWRPEIELAEGLRRTVEWCRAQEAGIEAAP
jgi:nucleoside-diphosphate-sugar epimerase